MDRADLIAALEKAEGPSRVLDCAIFLATRDVRQHRNWFMYHGMRAKGAPDDPQGFAEQHAPNYTRSLDAALSLVPNGYAWLFKSFGVATVYKIPPSDDDETWPIHHDANGPTPAIALCIAALRAMD